MIKCLVFDLDGTLIMWRDEYKYLMQDVFNRLNIEYTLDDIDNIDNAIETYEDIYDIYTKENLLNHINKNCNLNLPLEFVSLLIEKQQECYVYDQKLYDTIEYLSTKYELVVLTNWFKESQVGRLKGCKIYDFFKFVSCGDERELKPNKKAFDVILKKYNPKECIMIGDSVKKDISPALQLGFDVILVKPNVKRKRKYKVIDNIYELKEML